MRFTDIVRSKYKVQAASGVIKTNEPIKIAWKIIDGMMIVKVDGIDYVIFDDVQSQNDIDAKFMNELKKWIEETYYSDDYKSSAFEPCRFHKDSFGSKQITGGPTSQEKKDAARYLWFVIKGDGSIYSGYEEREDCKDDLKELKESPENKNAKIVSRSKVDPSKLEKFYKGSGVPKNMLGKGHREAKRDAKLDRADPFGAQDRRAKRTQGSAALGAARKLKRDVKTKDGRTFPKDSPVDVKFFGDKNNGHYICEITVQGDDDSNRTFKAAISSLPTTVSGFTKPSIITMNKWMSDGIAKTPTGKKTETDGYGDDGSPSWLLALGLI